MTEDDILADVHSRIMTKQQLTVPQIAYTELWVSAVSPQSSLLIVPCVTLQSASSAHLACQGQAQPVLCSEMECHGVGNSVRPALAHVAKEEAVCIMR